jgi:glutathione peroxidase
MGIAAMPSLYDFQVRTLDGQEQSLASYRGQVLLIVNVASKCGFTPQYTELEQLYRRHRDDGFAVLGFPCNQFLSQEPGDAAAIQQFCSLQYDVTFPLFAKLEVNGPHTHPLYQFLKHQRRGLLGTTAIKWNFTKFLIDRQGQVIRRYAPTVKPSQIEAEIVSLLALSAV